MRISDWSSDVCSSDLLADLRLRGVDLRPRLVARGAGQVDVAFRHQLLRAKHRLAAVIRFGVGQRRLRLLQRRPGAGDLGVALVDLRFKGARVDACDDLSSEEHTSELQSLMRTS